MGASGCLYGRERREGGVELVSVAVGGVRRRGTREDAGVLDIGAGESVDDGVCGCGLQGCWAAYTGIIGERLMEGKTIIFNKDDGDWYTAGK